MQTLNLNEASDYLGIPEAQLVRWALQDVGPNFSGHPLRPDRLSYSQADLDGWLKERCATPQ